MGSFRILLVRPPYRLGRLPFINSQVPLNLAYLAAALRHHGFTEVSVLDFEVTPYERKTFEEYLRRTRPRVVGVTAFTPTITEASRIASSIKEIVPDSFVLAGGPHVSALPRETLAEFGAWDAVAIGEGELTIVDVCAALSLENAGSLSRIPGVLLRTAMPETLPPPRRPVQDLDSLPFPARDLLDMRHYRGQVFRGFSRDYLRIGELITSRGCPNNCVFCASKITMGRRVRFRSPHNVLEEIADCMRDYTIRHVSLLDDTFNLHPSRLEELCRGFQRLGITWNCLATVSNMRPEMLEQMARSGCVGITFGIESGSPRILELNGKNITRQQALDAVRWARKAGIKTIEVDFMVGSHPSETPEDLEMSADLIKKLKPDILSVQPLIPYPGTEAHRILEEKGLLGSTRWDDYLFFGTVPTWRLEHLDSRDLLRYQRRMLRRFYFSPPTLLRRLRKIGSWRELLYYSKVGLNILRRL